MDPFHDGHHVRLRRSTHAAPHPGEGGEVANFGLRPAPLETPSGRFLAATGAPVPRAKKHRGFDDDEPGAFPVSS